MIVVLWGCIDEGGTAGTYCRNSGQCRGELICVSLTCREPPRMVSDAGSPSDASVPPVDVGPVDAGPEDARPEDAVVPTDAPPDDAGEPEDASVMEDAGVDAGIDDPCGPIAAVGHTLCVREPGRCEAVFTGGGTSCNGLCTLAGLSCTGAFTPSATMCTYDAGASTGCGNGSRSTLHCICT